MYCSGHLSNRSKSMTSHSGDSFVCDVEVPPPTTPMRCHTALGICSSSSSLSQEYVSGGSADSLCESGAVSSTPCYPSPNAQCSSVDEADQSPEAECVDENRNATGGFETVHEGQLLDSQERHAKGKNITGFLKKFTTSKRKRANGKGNNSGTL